ncbi:MAG: TetR/AcrR family transcriptional regulator [Streptosporangiaceae bacterium]|nr:TetR/AcrR family transcriptional regulator [Streptosporangiaceae bacterium]
MKTDHTPSRRRGEALERAIVTAVWEELAEVGYAKLTMEGVAARAHTSKPVLYRRWSTRVQLVVAAMTYGVPTRDELPDTGDLRSDVLTLLRQLESRFDDLPTDAIRGLMFEVLGDPEAVAIREYVVQTRCEDLIMVLLERAAARGEIDPAKISRRIARVPKDIIRSEYLTRADFNGRVPDDVITEIVDEVFLPLVRPVVRGD